MKIKVSLSKVEKIGALLNQWDPVGLYKTSSDYRVYMCEAEEIAQSIRSNSKSSTVEKAIKEAMAFKMEKSDLEEDEKYDNALKVMAKYMLEAIRGR